MFELYKNHDEGRLSSHVEKEKLYVCSWKRIKENKGK